jgi:hypothetical protein
MQCINSHRKTYIIHLTFNPLKMELNLPYIKDTARTTQ